VSALTHLLSGLADAVTLTNLLWVTIGVILGTIVGILPGLGSPAAVLAILLPLTIALPPTTGLIFMAGIYHGSKFAGSTTAILLNIPTETSSIVLCLDGHPLAKRGRAGAAMGMSAISGFVASTIGVFALTFAAPAAARLALTFEPPEFLALMLFGLVLVIVMASESAIKGFISMTIGLLLSTVGLDIFSNASRYTFGNINLDNGIQFLTLSVGLFAVGEVLINMEKRYGTPIISMPWSLRRLLPTRDDLRNSRAAIAIGSVVGFVIGAIPGGGSTIGSFISYNLVKNASRNRSQFGKGAIEGVAGPEAANNSEVGGAMIPLLSMGLPGNASTAVMLGALLLYGLQPGPLLFTSHPGIVWPVIASLYLGNLMLLVLNLPLIPLWVQILRIPQWILYSSILVLAVVGAFSIRDSVFDVWMLILFSALGYAIRKVKIPPAPLLMAFVLGSQFESNLRLSMILSRNNPMIFVERPISASILAVIVIMLGATALARLRRRPAQEIDRQGAESKAGPQMVSEGPAGEVAERN
jgi:putative tricarboxylic transport membrane protein